MPDRSPTLTRTIRFYHLEWTLRENGQRTIKPIGFLRQIFQDQGLVPYGDGEHLVVRELNYEEEDTENRSYWVLSRIRSKDLPQICDDNGDNVTKLLLDSNKGLRDPNHFIIFNNGVILGAECNRQSRDVRLALIMMVHKWIQDHPDAGISNFDIKSLSKKKLDLEHIRKIKKFHLRSSPAIVKNLVAGDNSFSEVFEENEEMRVEITLLGNTRRRRGTLSLHAIKEFIQSHLEEPSQLENIDMLKIEIIQENGDGKYEEVNLLDNYLVTKKQVVKIDNETKGVDQDSMFAEIKASYDDHKEDIDRYLPRS